MNDHRADPVLYNACHMDVQAFCSDVEPGEGQVHACLRKNWDKIRCGAPPSHSAFHLFRCRPSTALTHLAPAWRAPSPQALPHTSQHWYYPAHNPLPCFAVPPAEIWS